MTSKQLHPYETIVQKVDLLIENHELNLTDYLKFYKIKASNRKFLSVEEILKFDIPNSFEIISVF